MKITQLSIVAIAGITLSVQSYADVKLDVGGQAVLYYQTMDSNGKADFFDHGANSRANVGLQINLNSDLGNDFKLGYQETFLGTLGLEKNLVGASMQTAGTNELNAHNMSKLFIQKDIANTTLKLGRQELAKSVSPFAFSENWNVFKNTFDAAVVVNKDIVDTTLVGAYVSRGNGQLDKMPGLVNLGDYQDLAGGAIDKGAYMLTAVNESIEKVPLTLSYYKMPTTNLSAVWADAKFKNLGMVKVALQGGSIMNGATGGTDTTAMGAKIGGKVAGVSIALAYSTVNDGDVKLVNVGTGIKTPLYTNLILNQRVINSDNDTVLLSAVAPLKIGKAIVKYAMTKDNSAAGIDYNELDILYKFDALGTKMFLGYIMEDETGKDKNNLIRFWSRYTF